MKIANIEVAYVDIMGSDLSIVNAARVSFDKTSEWHEEEVWGVDEHGDYVETVLSLKRSDEKLIKYLAKHKHKSPFNHTFITVKVKAPIFVSRQLVKHKFMPWNEESRRYINTEPEFYVPSDYRLAAENVKQGSSSELFQGYFETEEYHGVDRGIEEVVQIHAEHCLGLYNQMLAAGICNEQARMVLPQNMMVNWMWSGTLGAFADMLVLRLDSHTQFETRIVAEKIRDIVLPLFPVSLQALLDNS